MDRDRLASLAAALGARKGGARQGLLAADESPGTIGKRFEAAGVACTPESRRAYREILLRSEALGAQISGVILHDETIRQTAADGESFVAAIARAGAIPGVKVDRGVTPLPGFPGESATEGLDGLAARLAEYRAMGARFAKWRAVIDVGMGAPSDHCLNANAQALARYAAHCHAADLVPIVEPEVLMDGDHDLAHCYAVSKRTLNRVFAELHEARVFLEGVVLKPNMVVPGLKNPRSAQPEETARATLRLLRTCVPVAVPTIAFLSGGQGEVEASANLDAINRLGPLPWAVTFSFGRALQESAQKTWAGKAENAAQAQRVFAHRARMNALAAAGRWEAAFETRA
jgi:fructose-bisphosphate aldolase class I